MVVRVAVLTGILGVVGYGSLFAWVVIRNEFYPWTDWAAPHAVLHIVNESDREVRVGWRWADDNDWNPLLSFDRTPGTAAPRSDEVMQLGPLIPTEYWHKPVPAGYAPPSDDTKNVVIRVETAGFGSIEHTFTVGLDQHAQVRVTADHRVLLATGGESLVGYANYGPESELALR
jgi:hypothetical protein